MRKAIRIILFVFLLCSNLTAQQNFLHPYKKGNYFEFLYKENQFEQRYSAKITGDTTINKMRFQFYDIKNEPALGDYRLIVLFDSINGNFYQYKPICEAADSNGNILINGLTFESGYNWYECQTTGIYMRSFIHDTSSVFILNDTSLLKASLRHDTIGGTINSYTDYIHMEKYGFVYFFRPHGGITANPYEKILKGAIIDGITYGTITLNLNQISSEIPAGYLLKQNFPNPFNPSTVIQFDIPRNENVRLAVYDRLGKEIETLVNEKKTAGTYQYIFNAKNLASGIYFYKLSAGEYTVTKKMILVK